MFSLTICGKWLRGNSFVVIHKCNDNMWPSHMFAVCARAHVCRYMLCYQECIPCEQLVMQLCDIKQSYTQSGGMLLLVLNVAEHSSDWSKKEGSV